MLIKIAKICLIGFGILFLLLLLAGAVLMLDWPWWTGFFILLGLAGLIVGVIFLRKLWLRKKEQRFVNNIIAEDDSRLKNLAEKEKKESQALQTQWREAIQTLRRSHLRKKGNPLYVLPWYLVIGESGAGKTTAIKSARLSSPFAESTKVSGISGTKNCDWWFFEQCIIIDTAGRYAIPVDEGRDKDEWLKFLTLLTKYRKKEPLNGLIVTLPADKLFTGQAEDISEDGRRIRRRIDELMLAMGTKFPIYLLVTKCDLIQGMTQFCDQLPENGSSQAMGYINRDLTADADSLERNTLESMGDRLRDLRLLLLHQPDSKKPDSSFLLFPEEFERMQPGLASFINGAFQENPYQETPILRGIFFSSGRQEGAPYSHFLKALGLIEEKEVLPGTSKGLFLHDFFSRILPADRGIFAPTQRTLEWKRLTKNLGLTSWVAIGIALCGLMSFSFVKNLHILRDISGEFRKAPVLHGEILSDAVILDRFRQAIMRVEDYNRDWWIPRFGLNESLDVETGLKKKFCAQFNKNFLNPLDHELIGRMADFSESTPEITISRHMAHLVRRITLLRARLENNALMPEGQRPSLPYKVIGADDAKILPEIRSKVAALYIHYLLWTSDVDALNREMNGLQKWLKHILVINEGRLDWLIAWANDQESLPAVRLDDFWGGGVKTEDVNVPPAYTLEGKRRITAFLGRLEAALPDPGPPLIARQKIAFQKAYAKNYVEAWAKFAENFPKGRNKLSAFQDWQRMVPNMAKEKGPYFGLLTRMAKELDPFAGSGSVPPWMELIYSWRSIKAESATLAASEDPALTGGGVHRGGTRIRDLVRRTVQKAARGGMEEQIITAKAYLDYRAAINEIIPVSSSRKMAYDMTSQVFNEESVSSSNPFYRAQRAVFDLKAHLGAGKPEEDIFWNLMNGPLDFVWEFVLTETGCYLQDLWDRDVLAEVQGIADQKNTRRLLLGQGGLAEKFINDPAAPFLSRKPGKGYYARRFLGGGVPFTKPFLSFLTRGAAVRQVAGKTYDVNIEGLPTETNPDAQTRPHATHLKIQCADDTLKLDNFQYPVRKTFQWSPDSCGDVVFEIEVGDLTLTKKYSGYLGFPKFLRDFKTGQKTFKPDQFPDKEAALERYGIDYIKVNYKLSGHKKVLGLFKAAPGSVPATISQCWE